MTSVHEERIGGHRVRPRGIARRIAILNAASTPGQAQADGVRAQARRSGGADERPTSRVHDHADSAVDILLADLEDALLAYDRFSARLLDGKETESPHFEHIALPFRTPAPTARGGREDPDPDASLKRCDAVVVGTALVAGELAGIDQLLAHFFEQRESLEGMRTYAIVAVDGTDPSPAREHLLSLARTCTETGLFWGGGAAIGGSRAVVRFAGEPRMGIARRRQSEAIDHLIGAVRSGLSIARAAEAFGSFGPLDDQSILEARGALPQDLYRLLP